MVVVVVVVVEVEEVEAPPPVEHVLVAVGVLDGQLVELDQLLLHQHELARPGGEGEGGGGGG